MGNAKADPPAERTPLLLSIEDVAERLGVEKRSVRRLTLKRNGLRYVRVGRFVKFRPEWVDQYIDRGGR